MSVLIHLTDYLHADMTISPALIGGTNMFYGLLPPEPDLCVVLFEYGSLPPALSLGSSVIDFEYPQIQVLVRGAENDYDTPRELIEQVMNSFVKIGDQTLGGVRYGCVSPKQSPYYIARDQNFRCHFACNFHVMKDIG